MNDKNSTLAALHDEFNQWQSFLSGLSDAQAILLQPDGLSIRDVIGHLHAWLQLSVARLEAAQHGSEPVYPDWAAGLFPDDEEYLEQFNATIHDTYARQAWPSVYEAWRASSARLLELSAALPAADMVNPNKYPWLRGYAPIDVLRGALEHHAEHREAFQE